MENTQINAGNIVKVLLSLNGEGYDYRIPSGGVFFIGDIVRAPLRGKLEYGVIWNVRKEPLDYPAFKVKEIESRAGECRLSRGQMEFIERVAEYNVSPTGNVLKMTMGFDGIFEEGRKKFKPAPHGYLAIPLSAEQEAAARYLEARLGQGFSASVLYGITGSGKTEVYFKVIAKVLETAGSQVLILLPEISLTGQFLTKFESRFGARPALWHSGIAKAERRETWKAAANGSARVAVGTRSALFLPFSRLSLIVLDEEHDGSYKQEDGVIYQGRDMAVLKASIEKIPIILASATPSIETINNVRRGKYGEVRLNSRYGEASVPDIELIDMRHDKPQKQDWGQAWLSETAAKKIEAELLNGNQAMIYINRRGYAPLVLCGECGHRLTCPNCSVFLTAHNKDETRLFCHHCGYSTHLPKQCPKCAKEGGWALVGPGIERIEEEARHRFPAARIATISSDMLTSQGRLNEIIAKIERRETDIIIGTQILVKGHHFPNLTLVAAVDGDMSLSGGDPRANENTFQLLTQVSGRSGRGKLKGEVIIQTYNPDHPVMQAIKNNDRDSFVAQELADRKNAGMPPFAKLAAILISGRDKFTLERFASELARAAPVGMAGVSCYGPIDAPLAVINRQHRKRFLITAAKSVRIQDVIRKWLARAYAPPSIKMKVDIDPYNFM